MSLKLYETMHRDDLSVRRSKFLNLESTFMLVAVVCGVLVAVLPCREMPINLTFINPIQFVSSEHFSLIAVAYFIAGNPKNFLSKALN